MKINLTGKQKQWIAWIVIAVLISSISTFLGIEYAMPPAPTFEQEQEVQDDEVVELGVTHFTSMRPEHWYVARKQTAFVCTAGCVITMTGTYQPLDAASGVSCTLGTISSPSVNRDPHLYGSPTFNTGSELQITNISPTYTISISEGTTSQLTATRVDLDQYDTMFLIFDGTYWLEKAFSDN